MAACYRARPDGIDLVVRLTPKSSADAIEGVQAAANGAVHLAARVRAMADKGAANAALERLLADRLDLSKRAVSVVAGSTSRLKAVRLTGDAAEIAKAIETAIRLARPDGIDLVVRLTPKSSADAIEGVQAAADGAVHLAARVRAAPDKGAANAALERLLADRLDLPKRAVSVVAGSTSRLKTVRLTGDAAKIAEAIETAIRLARPGGRR